MKPAKTVCCGLVAVLLTAAAKASEPETAAELTLTPAEVALAGGEATRVLAVVKTGDRGLSEVRLHVTPLPGLSVRPEAAEAASWEEIEAGDSRSVDLLVERDRGGAGTGTVPLRLTWRRPSGSNDRGTSSGVLVNSLKVTDAPRLMSQIVELEVQSAIEKIEDRRHGGMAYVVVKNLTNHRLTVTGVRCYAPYFLEVRHRRPEPPEPSLWISAVLSRLWHALTDADGASGAGTGSDAEEEAEKAWSCGDGLPLPTVEAGSSRALPFQITADVVEPGQHTVAWELDLAWSRGDAKHQGAAVAVHDFTLAVLGESDLLQLFAWPSILVLPGALMILAFLTLRKRVWPRSQSDLSATDAATKAEFWLIAVALSFLAAMLYPWLTGKLGDPRDFIAVHGLDDIVNLWLGSVLLALLAWALWYGGKLAVQRFAEELQRSRERRTLPRPQDNPLEVIAKLERAGRPDIQVETAEVTLDGIKQPARVLFDLGEEGTWVGPPVEVICRDAETQERLDPLRDGGPKALLEALRDGRRRGDILQVRWKVEGGAGLRGPKRVAADDVAPSGGSVRLVELAVAD